MMKKMMTKTIDTLVEDIEGLFNDGHQLHEALAGQLGLNIGNLVGERLAAYANERKGTLRLSNIGRPDRQVWYEVNDPNGGEPLPANTKTKFLFGDVWEQLLLLLAKAAGHEVTHEQVEVDVGGVKGHPDAIIDGVVVDIKSCSSYAFKKFKEGTLRDSDAFGYIGQLAGYVYALKPGAEGAFLAVDKVSGSLCLLRVSADELAGYDVQRGVEHKKVVVDGPIPERCFEAVPEGKSGNMKLGVNCSYCGWKHKCWSDANDGNGIRTFLYSTGPAFLTKVERQPNVFEVGKAEVEFEF